MDLTENKVQCEACWAPVDQNDFGLCVSCKAPFHVDCRRSSARCPTFGCGGITLMTSKDYLAGAGRDLPEDTDARVKVLLARRQSLLDEYQRANHGACAAGTAFFAISGVFAAFVAVTNIGASGVFAGVLIGTFIITGLVWYLSHDTTHLLSRIALIDLELGTLGRNWDGSAKAPAPAAKAA